MKINTYSQSLYELSKEQSIVDNVENDSKNIINAIKKIGELKDFLKNPTSKKEDHINVISEISLKFQLNKLTEKFLKFLAFKRRIFYLEEILKDFLSYCSIMRGEVNAELISSQELSDSDIKKIKDEITENFGSKINLKYKVDKNLLAGMKIKIGSLMIDNSLKNKLLKLRKEMMEE
tara:strand:- start:707 stop:1237 length:531 start_codon:yes stop_codon:yes gene_type:complete